MIIESHKKEKETDIFMANYLECYLYCEGWHTHFSHRRRHAALDHVHSQYATTNGVHWTTYILST